MSGYAFVLLRCQPRRLNRGDWWVRAMVRGVSRVTILLPADESLGDCSPQGAVPWELLGREVALHVDRGAAGQPFALDVLAEARFEDATLMVLPVPRAVIDRVAVRQGELFGGES